MERFNGRSIKAKAAAIRRVHSPEDRPESTDSADSIGETVESRRKRSARIAIQNSAMDAALKAETKTLSKKTARKAKPSELSDLRRENERLTSELSESNKKIKAFEKWQKQARQALDN